MFGASLKHRRRQPELMDQPGLSAERHERALDGLERINWLSGSARIVWPALAQLARRLHPQPCRVLDVATGAGDVLRRLSRRAARAGLALELAGCDISPVALHHAERASRAAGWPLRFVSCDVLREGLPDGYDAVMCSLFLHHLDEPDAVELLRRMGGAARHLVLVNDLRRSRVGYGLAWLVTRLLTRSDVVHVDGPLSVAGAFTPAEALELARRAGLPGATVAQRWPYRFLLSWERSAHE